jgi:hypothetical protein
MAPQPMNAKRTLDIFDPPSHTSFYHASTFDQREGDDPCIAHTESEDGGRAGDDRVCDGG